MRVAVCGAGIGGLTLALALRQHAPEIEVQIYEAAPEIRPLGLGINLMPHAVRVLSNLGLQEALAARAVEATEFTFVTSRGQLIHREPSGRSAGHACPHFSIHRADLHDVLLAAVLDRLGDDHVHTDHRVTAVVQDGDHVILRSRDDGGRDHAPVVADVVVGADGLHSAVRRGLYPDEGAPVFHGINMWRGATRARPFLSGSSATRIGALHRTGKLVVYPIRNHDDGTQLVNWVAEVVTDAASPTDWSAPGRLEDFLPRFESWRFDWLDCADLIRSTERVLSYPMADRDPVERWTFGRVTLLGDAAHPMYPRGGNGAAQAILDAESLATHLGRDTDPADALAAYEAERLPVVNAIVVANRTTPPDVLIDTVEERLDGGTFERIEDVISAEEIEAVLHGYQRVAGYDRETVARRTAG